MPVGRRVAARLVIVPGDSATQYVREHQTGRQNLSSSDTWSSAGEPPAEFSPHVLVVDDEPGIRGFVHAILQAEGYSVAIAANGQQALERIAEQRPDVILLDLSMPVMNGWQLNEYLRERRFEIPVVFMTAGFSARAEAQAHGAADYLAKPFDVDTLLDVIGRFAGTSDS